MSRKSGETWGIPGEVGETIAKNRMRPEGQPPSDRIIRVFLSRHRLPRRRRHECYSQHLPARGAACAEARLSTGDRAITNLEPLRCKQLCLALKSKTGGGGRNARATSLRLRAILEVPLGDSLSRITAAARSPQSSGRARNHHVSLKPNFFQFVAGRNTKKGRHCEQTVDDETSLWKVEENLELFVA